MDVQRQGYGWCSGLSVPWLLFLLIAALVAPWGDFPLNDDWSYALVAQGFAQTGIFKVDVPVAPSLLGQTLLAWPVIKAFGFSHVGLRCLTLLLGSSFIYAFGLALRAMGVPARERLWSLLVFTLSPLFCYYSMTFMTEIYGYVMAAWGIAWWFIASARLQDGRPMALSTCIGVGLLIGSAFWTRQYCVLPYPALLTAGALTHWLTGDQRLWRQLLYRYGCGLAGFALLIIAYFQWAAASGHLRQEFSTPLTTALTWQSINWRIEPGVILVYMTMFFLPLLWFGQTAGAPRRWLAALLAAIAAVLIATKTGVLAVGDAWDHVDTNLHRSFPYAGNVLFDGGIGPITLSDVFLLRLPARLQWPRPIWDTLEPILLLASLLWAPFLYNGYLHVRNPRCRGRLEGLLFGILLAGGSLLVIVQAHGIQAFDRYFFPVQLGLVFAVACTFNPPTSRPAPTAQGSTWLPTLRRSLAALSLAALAVYTVGGLHDQFRWQEARWQLYQDLLARGIHSTNIDGGYEVQGWMNFAAWNRGRLMAEPQTCINFCHCNRGWYCPDDSYRISMNIQPGEEALASILPSYWLSSGPRLYATRRTGSRPLK